LKTRKSSKVFLNFQKERAPIFAKEDEVYYPHVDAGKRIPDRELIAHAAQGPLPPSFFALKAWLFGCGKKSRSTNGNS